MRQLLIRIPVFFIFTIVMITALFVGCMRQHSGSDDTTEETYIVVGYPEMINRPVFCYNGELYMDMFEAFYTLDEGYKLIGEIVSNDQYNLPRADFHSCSVSEGAEIYMNGDLSYAMVSMVHKDGTIFYRKYILCDDKERRWLEKEESRAESVQDSMRLAEENE